MLNNVIPRLGEISRPVYVAKKEGLSSSNLIGTIVIERLIDLLTMVILIALAAVYLIRDAGVLQQLFGTESWPAYTYFLIPAFFAAAFGGIWILYKILTHFDDEKSIDNKLLNTVIGKARSFSEGMASVKDVKNWPAFLLLTAGIWLGYILMTYLPFYMIDLQGAYGLTISDAVVLTMVSSIGVSIPTPAGIGSYHLLIQQSMHVLYNIPLVTALTYATIAHGVTVILVFASAPLALFWDKYNSLKRGNIRARLFLNPLKF
jgi:glycosyltransferase 2 family protein